MADSSPRRSRNYGSLVGSTRSRRSRASLRVPSNRSSSLVYDEYLHPSGPATAHALRSASSRFSLNEQFATSRQEYDFSFDDDASSIYERTAPVSEAGDVAFDRLSPAPLAAIDESWQSIPPPPADEVDSDEDYYDLLCLPRDPSITPHQIRQAYWRLLFLLHTDAQAMASGLLSNVVFVRLQQAFETLIDPLQRANYDSRQIAGIKTLAEAEVEDNGSQLAYRDALIHHLSLPGLQGTASATEVAVRFDASRSGDHGDSRGAATLRPTDFVMDHSLTTVVPISGAAVWQSGQVQLHNPEVTVSGLVSGRLGNKVALSGSTRAQKTQPWPPLAGTGSGAGPDLPTAPIVAFKLRQDITLQAGERQPSRYTVECEKELLAPGLTARVSHPVHIGGAREPWIIQATLHCGQSRTTRVPLLGIGAHHVTPGGVFLATANSGSWGAPLDATCRSFAEFSRQIMSQGEEALNLPPNLELGYSTHDADFASLPYRPTDPDGRALIAPKASWSASSTLTPHSAAGFLRYARDVLLPAHPGSPLSQTPTRLELEVSSDTFLRHSLALRSLWRVGTYSCLGLEVSVGSQTVHLSLHWSRLKHRLSLPLLIASPAASAPTTLAFWLAAVPFSVIGGAQIFLSRQRHLVRKTGRTRSPDELHAYITRKRLEAMEFTKLISSAVEARQQQRRIEGELVIVRATYGAARGLSECQKSTEETVADVTTALAALIDGEGRLFIPAGLRKSGLPGFWDAAPGQAKTLRVRYSYRGYEIDVEVTGRNGLILPSS